MNRSINRVACSRWKSSSEMSMTTGLLRALLMALPALLLGSQPAVAAPESSRVTFGLDVAPVLTRSGCNSGGCHGKAAGQNGFRLSLLGFEPGDDYAAIVREGGGRRLSRTDPARSLLLLKATGAVPHGGGRPLSPGSEGYRAVLNWIASGAVPPSPGDPTVTRVVVEPASGLLVANSSRQLKVSAVLSNGARRDVTRAAVYQSNEPDLASVDANGLVRTGVKRGLVTVMARFGEQIATFHGAVPFTRTPAQAEAVSRRLASLTPRLESSPVDRHLLRQWRQMGVAPSEPVDDVAYLRRVSFDLCGTAPTPAEIDAFLADRSPDKRSRWVDRLLERPEYAAYFGLKWADILQNRGAGYSTSKQRAGTALFSNWIRQALAANMPYDRFASEILTATGSQAENPPTVWYRTVRKGPEYVESVAQAFLGVRIQCAQCHHHPAERWSQSDYYGFAAIFARVGRKGGFADAEVPTEEVIYLKDGGSVQHPRTGATMHPRPLGGPAFGEETLEDPRAQLARWMTSESNPFFARTLVNRLWAHFLGRGLVDPIDDSRSTNPPSNPELLDALSREFVRSKFDVKQLIRTLVGSYAYQLQSAPNEWNAGDTQTFARFYPRRLSAEVLLDAFSQALEVPTEFTGGPGRFPAGTRAIELPDENVPATFLDVFGRPARRTACECERADAPALAQALELVNSAEIQRKLTAPTGYALRISKDPRAHPEKVREVFLKVLGRAPSADELAASLEHVRQEPDGASAYRSLLWSLLATNEFLFNH